jgi:hypothetical protein
MRRITAGVCLVFVAAALAAASPAAAKPGFGFTSAKFRVEVEGVQTTAWEANRPLRAGACEVGWKGNGTEVLRFASKPVVASAMSYAAYDPILRTGKRPGVELEMPARVTRRSDFSQWANPCTDGDGTGGETPPAPDCGRRTPTVHADLVLRLGRLSLDTPSDLFVPLPLYRNCHVEGTAFPDLLWRQGPNAVGKRLSARKLFGGPRIRTITVGRRDAYKGAYGWWETTLKYTITLTRIGKVREF